MTDRQRQEVKDIFQSFPAADKLYKDARGAIWTNKATAELQGGAMEVYNRADYIQAGVKKTTNKYKKK